MISFLKKTLKVIFWVIIGFLLLFITIVILIQIPAIQTRIVKYATTYVSDKTHTRVEIKKVSIGFPKSVVIEDIFLEDTKKDTLLYAGKIKVDIALFALLHSEINVRSLALEDVNINLNRTETDSLFNFNFLITAFSDSVKKPKVVDTTKKSKWTFSADKVSLKNIRFHFNDKYGGTDVAVKLEQLKLNVDKIDIPNLVFGVDNIKIESVAASVLLMKSGPASNDTSSGKLPIITVGNLQITHSLFTFGDSVSKMSILASINSLGLKGASVDLPQQKISLDNLFLSKSYARLLRRDDIISDTTLVKNYPSANMNDWKISAKNIDLEDNSLAYVIVNKPPVKNAFDANHLIYKYVTLSAADLYYSKTSMHGVIKNITAVDQNEFSITSFQTDFSMDQHSITANNLKAKTRNSDIDADLSMQFSTLQSFRDSLAFVVVNAVMNKVSVRNSDITYFAPQLARQKFFRNVLNITHISGIIHGPLNNLYGKNVEIKTGINTSLHTDFSAKGLPDFKTAYFDLPNLKISSGRMDILAIADTSIPKSIELPDNIDLQIVFKGQLKAFASTIAMKSSFGSAHIKATVDKNENFKGDASLIGFDLGRLLKNKEMFGQVSLTSEINGHGLDLKKIKANIKADVSQIVLNKYNYHNLKLDGNISGQEIVGKINLNDENAILALDALVNLDSAHRHYKFNLNLQGADLQKLNLTKDDIRIALVASADLKSDSAVAMKGKARINGVTIMHQGKQYVIDTLLIASVNQAAISKVNFSNALIGIKFTGANSPLALPKELSKFINNYFPFSDSGQVEKKNELKDFAFELQVKNHVVLSEALFPQIKEFEPILFQASYDSAKTELILNAGTRKIVYGSFEVNNFVFAVHSNSVALDYKIAGSSVANKQIKLDNVLVDGKLSDNTVFANISSIGEDESKKLLIRSQISKVEGNYKIALNPKDFYLMNDRWDIAEDNYIELGKQGFLIHHLFISKTESQINIASVNDKFNDDLKIEVKNFDLSNIFGIIEKDSSLVGGIVDGNVLFKRVNNAYGIIADAAISDLVVSKVPIGNLSVKAENPTTEKFDIDVNLSGVENNLTAKGHYIPNGGDNSININGAIQSLSLKTIEAFSMGSISEASGSLSGNFLVSGKSSAPDITGEVTFNNAFIKPSFLNNRLELKHETVQLKKDGAYFNSFTIRDAGQHAATIDGIVKMEHFSNFVFTLNVNTKDFILFNTTAKDNKEFYGRMVIDSKINIKGPIELPVVDAKIKMKKGSNFTFAVPEKRLTTDKGEDVVEFNDSVQLNSILGRNNKKEIQKFGLTGFDISSIVEVDKEATLRLLLDPSSTDSLVVKGEAALSFTIDRSGKMSLTGAYNLNEGSYLVSLESVMKRKFDIQPGGTIIWNGELLGAEISLNAVYSVRASPFDLIADQMSDMSETDKNQYKQRFPFLIILKLRGELLHPAISFEIQLPPEDKGILGGAVNAKLNMLNEDPSSLNKQVFALLVLGRFIQENPLQSETGSAITIVRTTVSKYLSAQLNQLTSKLINGIEINFDIQSYDDYQSGTAVGRTQVDIGVKKQLFQERVSVQVGGTVEVEGPQAKQNNAADIISDVTVEYKLTKDGRYRLKGFRHNQYEGAIEGQLVETGIGVMYVRDYNSWKELFTSPAKSDSSKKVKNEKNNSK